MSHFTRLLEAYARMSDSDREELDRHFDICTKCRRAAARTVDVSHLWQRLTPILGLRTAATATTRSPRRLIAVAVAFAATLILGVPAILLGGQSDEVPPAASEPSTTTRPVVTVGATPAPVIAGDVAECSVGAPGQDLQLWSMAFLEALNGRDYAAFDPLAGGMTVNDIGHFAYGSTVNFATLEDWVSSTWAQNESWTPVGFLGGLDVSVERRSDTLRGLGLERVVSDFRFTTDGCTVTALEVTVPVGDPAPCGFIEAFPETVNLAPDQSVVRGCLDGTATVARSNHTAVSVGDRLLVLGGYAPGGSQRQDGFLLSATGTVDAVDAAPFDSFILGAASTSSGILTWGTAPVRVALLDLESLTWQTLAQPDRDLIGPSPGVWTGTSLILANTDPGTGQMTLLEYSLSTDTWKQLEGFPLADRSDASVVWTGSEAIFWGGANGTDFSDGAAFNPETRSWRILAESPLEPRVGHSAVWTGSQMLVWGGQSVGVEVNTGATYDPQTDQWTQIPDAPVVGRYLHSSVWTGSELVVWGGVNAEQELGTGAAFNPLTSAWREVASSTLSARCGPTAVWTGTSVFLFGGWTCGSNSPITLGDGALDDPMSDTWTPVAPK